MTHIPDTKTSFVLPDFFAESSELALLMWRENRVKELLEYLNRRVPRPEDTTPDAKHASERRMPY